MFRFLDSIKYFTDTQDGFRPIMGTTKLLTYIYNDLNNNIRYWLLFLLMMQLNIIIDNVQRALYADDLACHLGNNNIKLLIKNKNW